MTLDGKIALVTGAGRGIGRGCAEELARAGAAVVMNDRPGSAELPDAVAAVRGLSPSVQGVAADVFSREGCEQCIAETLKAHGRTDLLVCNPAYSRRGAFLDYDPAVFQQVLRGTLEGAFHLSQLAAREMVRQGHGGKIVFISSVQAEMPLAGSVAYNAAKAGLNQMARTIAADLAVHKINVNVIEPGWIDTPGERGTFTAEQIEREGAKLPWGRLGTPQDIGRAAAFLCSDAADYITGSVLVVDGGFRLKDCRAEEAILPGP